MCMGASLSTPGEAEAEMWPMSLLALSFGYLGWLWEALCVLREGSRKGPGGQGRRQGRVLPRLGLSFSSEHCRRRSAWSASQHERWRKFSQAAHGAREGPSMVSQAPWVLCKPLECHMVMRVDIVCVCEGG